MDQNPTIKQLEEKIRFLEGLLEKRTHDLANEMREYVAARHELDTQFRELEKFRQVVSQSPHMILITDLSGKIIYSNESFIQTMGYSPEDINSSIKVFKSGNNGEESYAELIKRSLAEKGHFSGEVEAFKKDGTSIWGQATLLPLLNDGKPEFYLAMMQDVTREKELQELNLQNQEKINTIMDNIEMLITLVDKQGFLVFHNKYAEKNLKLTFEQLHNKNLSELLPVEWPRIRKTIERICREKIPVFSEDVIYAFGRKNFYNSNRYPIFNSSGDVIYIMSISEDITQKKHQERLLNLMHTVDSLQSVGETFEESLRLLFDNLFELEWLDGAGLYIVDDEKQCVELIYHRGISNEFVKQTRVYSLDSPNAKAIFQKIPIYSQPHQFLKSSKEAVLDEKITFIAALPLVHRDTVVGSLNLASRKVSGIQETDKQALENISVKIANLMVLVQTREELTRTNELLQKNLDEIREKQELLTQKSKLESLGELSAGLAHEISQPLSVISLAFENIIYKLLATNQHSEYFSQKANTINLNISKIRQLIDHIRLFSRDQSSVLFEKVNVNNAVRDTLSLMKVQLSKHNIDVVLNLCEEECNIIGNLTKVEQVLMNLLSNARDALDEKERNTGPDSFSKVIRITSYRLDDRITLTIEDNGTGIPAGHLPKLFNPFFTTKPPGQGTGLGLSIVYGIVTEMKGTIEVNSIIDNFTTVKLSLPGI